MNEYATKVRLDIIDGMGPWKWPELDTGAWDGPVDDWNVSHKAMIETIANKRTVVQAGGNCGLYPALLSQMFEQVITFEPDLQNFHFLEENTMNLPNVMSFQNALGSEHKTVSMHHITEYNVGMHKVKEGDDIFMITLDSSISMLPGTEVDFIWYDLEGYEYNAIMGSLETIKRCKPHIAVENASGELYNLLDSLGYNILGPSKMDTFFIHKDKL
jgi:FkbM family methyltransferase